MLGRSTRDIEHGSRIRMLTPNERCQGGRFFRVILETGVDQIVQLSGFGEHYCHSTLSTDTATTRLARNGRGRETRSHFLRVRRNQSVRRLARVRRQS